MTLPTSELEDIWDAAILAEDGIAIEFPSKGEAISAQIALNQHRKENPDEDMTDFKVRRPREMPGGSWLLKINRDSGIQTYQVYDLATDTPISLDEFLSEESE